MPSSDLLLNLTSRNVSQWLVKSRNDYFKKRYGGFEFGVRNPLSKINYTWAQDIFEKLTRATNKGKNRVGQFFTDYGFGALEEKSLTSDELDNVRVWFNNKGEMNSQSSNTYS